MTTTGVRAGTGGPHHPLGAGRDGRTDLMRHAETAREEARR